MDFRPIYRAEIRSESSELVDLVTVAMALHALSLSLHVHSIKSKPGALIVSLRPGFSLFADLVVAAEVTLMTA